MNSKKKPQPEICFDDLLVFWCSYCSETQAIHVSMKSAAEANVYGITVLCKACATSAQPGAQSLRR